MVAAESTSERACAECGADISHRHRAAKYCSLKCKKRANYFHNITQEKERRAAFRAQNRERLASEARTYRADNRDDINARRRAAHRADPSRNRLANKRWRSANPDKVRKITESRREYARAYEKHRYATDPEYRKKHKLRRQARKRWRLTPEQVAQKLASQTARCAACRCNISSGFHLDHIIPQSKGGESRFENLQLLCAYCNIAKLDRMSFFPKGTRQGILVLG